MKGVFSFICLLIMAASHAQEGNLCQFMVSPVQFNPAFSGVYHGTFRLTALYKNQWASEISPYQIKAGSFEAGFADKGSMTKGANGIALTWFSDRAGETKTGTNKTAIIYSRAFYLGPHITLSAAGLFGMEQHVTDHQLLTWDSQYDGTGFNPAFGNSENIMNARPYLNAGAGIAFTYDKPESYMRANNQLKIRIGASVNYLNRPNRSFIGGYSSRINPAWMSFGDLIIPLRNSKWSFRPAYLLQRISHETFISFGLMMGYRFRDESVYTGRLPLFNFYYGVLYRAEQGPVLQTIAELGRFEFAAGYDFPVSALGRVAGLGGGFEFSLRYLIKLRNVQTLLDR